MLDERGFVEVSCEDVYTNGASDIIALTGGDYKQHVMVRQQPI